MKFLDIIYNGLVRENPTFVLMLGMCPTLGTTGSAMTGMSMGLTTMGVLICSNMSVSAIKSVVPAAVRIPVYIVLIATFVSVLQMLLAAYLPSLNATLGIFIPLIVVNCILLGRAEAFASRHGIIDSAADGIGIGLGFTVALTLIGSVRELLGTGRLFGAEIYPESYGSLLFILAPGAFIVLGLLMALFNRFKNR
jgi:electron transport complex protein RnfE